MTNTTEITCPNCQREVRVRPDYAGGPMVCDHCRHSFHPKVTIPCPQCLRTLHVRREYLGKRIFCSYCKHTFRAALEGAGHRPGAGPEWAVPGPIHGSDEVTRVRALESEVEKLRNDLSARTSEYAAVMLT